MRQPSVRTSKAGNTSRKSATQRGQIVFITGMALDLNGKTVQDSIRHRIWGTILVNGPGTTVPVSYFARERKTSDILARTVRLITSGRTLISNRWSKSWAKGTASTLN